MTSSVFLEVMKSKEGVEWSGVIASVLEVVLEVTKSKKESSCQTIYLFN